MAGFDYSLIGKNPSLVNKQQLQAEFELKKQLLQAKASGNSGATGALADRLIAEGVDPLQALLIAKSGLGVGNIVGADGTVQNMDGINAAVQARKMAEATGGNISDLEYKPQIASGEAQARQEQELRYAAPIKTAEVNAANEAAQIADLQKKASAASNTIGLTEQARTILNTGEPTGSGAGALLAGGKKLVGYSDKSTQANKTLDIIAGNLLNNVPRMEGPQSDYDVKSYKEQAGSVGDKTLPIGDRLAALAEIDRINQKYANIQTPVKSALGQGGEAPIIRIGPNLEDLLAEKARRQGK